MASTKNFGLIGVGSTVQIGKNGANLKNSGGILQARNAADSAYAKLQAADNTLFVDVTTERYVRTHGHVLVTGQIDGGSAPAVTDQAVFICTTTGTTYTAGYLYYGENAAWNEVIPDAGTSMSPATSLTGGTLEFTTGNSYIYSAGAWVNNTPVGSVLSLRATLAFGTSSPLNIGAVLPQDSRILAAYVKVTTPFDGTAPTLAIGYAGQTTIVMTTAENDLKTTGLYKVDCMVDVSASTQMIATYVADSSANGDALIELTYSIV